MCKIVLFVKKFTMMLQYEISPDQSAKKQIDDDKQ